MGFRLLNAGFPKSAKTGALAALANAGYTLRYLDFDQNADPMVNFTRPDARRNIQIVSCVDVMRMDTSGQIVVNGTQGLRAWKTLLDSMDEWPTDHSDPTKWGANNILVIDTLTEVAKGLARRQQVLENRQGKRYSWNDYDHVQKQIDSLLVLLKTHLTGGAHLIVNCHLQLVGPDLNVGDIDDESLRDEVLREKLRGADKVPWMLAPISFGKAQSKTIAGHFSGTLYFKAVEGRGRFIYTVPEDGFNAGVPADLPRELPLATGLATVFEKVCGPLPAGRATAPTRPAAPPRPPVKPPAPVKLGAKPTTPVKQPIKR